MMLVLLSIKPVVMIMIRLITKFGPTVSKLESLSSRCLIVSSTHTSCGFRYSHYQSEHETPSPVYVALKFMLLHRLGSLFKFVSYEIAF